MKKIKIFSLLLAIVMLFALAACGGTNESDTGSGNADNSASSTAAAEPSSPGQASTAPAATDGAPEATDSAPAASDGTPVATNLVYGAPGPIGIYLYGSNAATMDSLIWLVFDPIIYFSPITKEFTSDIVDYNYEDDYTLVLKVKDGVYFNNGEQLTGEDVLYTIQSEVSPERASRNASKFTIFNLDKSYVDSDGMTVYLITDNVEATALSNLYTPVLCKSWTEAAGWDSADWQYAPNGTGPYYVTESATGLYSVVTLKDPGTYWNTGFKSDILTVKGVHYDDKSVMFIDLENGDIDLAFQINSEDIARIASDGLDHLTPVTIPYDDVQLLSFDIDDGPTQDVNLRAAIAHGVNWDDVALAAWEDYGRPATSVLASTMGDMYHNVGQYEYNPDLAKEYADKITGSKEVEICIFTDPLYVQESEVMRSYLEKIGITLNVTVTDMATFFGNTAAGVGDLSFVRYPDGNFTYEPYLALRNFEASSTGPNTNLGADETISNMLIAARQTLDTSERAQRYAEIQQYFKDQYYAVPIAEVYGSYAYNNTRWAGADIIATNAANVRYVYCKYE